MNEINKELSKYSWKVKREFEKLFPCLHPLHRIEVFNKEYYLEQAVIKLRLEKYPAKYIEENYTPEILEIENEDEFWKRWNRYRKVKRFS